MTTMDYGYGCDARGGVPHRIYPRLLLVSSRLKHRGVGNNKQTIYAFLPFRDSGKGSAKAKKKTNQATATKKIYVCMVYDMTKPIVSQLIMIIIRAKMG